MPGYISEIDYYGETTDEFIEIALPAGTNPAGYSVQLYMPDSGLTDMVVWATFSLGTSVATIAGYDIYVLDSGTAGWDTPDTTGNLYPDDALALVDNTGTALQYISWQGYTTTATDGPAAGMTSTNIGTIASPDDSLQSDDGGASYYSQASPNSGSIPACFLEGTRILTIKGYEHVETLRQGAQVWTMHHGHQPLLWVWKNARDVAAGQGDQVPVLIQPGALGAGGGDWPLAVSPQHRVLLGSTDQGHPFASEPSLCKAKALCDLPRVRRMQGRQHVVWYHLLFARHEVICAEGWLTESLLLNPALRARMQRIENASLRRAWPNAPTTMDPALPIISKPRKPAKVQRPRSVLKSA